MKALLSYAREGDTIVIHSMDRLARNVDDLRLIGEESRKKGTDKLTSREIDQEIKAMRAEKRKRG